MRQHAASWLTLSTQHRFTRGDGSRGGGAATLTAPGQESIFTFKAMRSGLFIYHCATPPVSMHIANGIYGLILVEPPGGLPKVDDEYYVVQSDFHTTSAYKFGRYPTGAHPEGMLAFDLLSDARRAAHLRAVQRP